MSLPSCLGPDMRVVNRRCWYLEDRVPLCIRLKRPSLQHQTSHPVGQGSGAAMCPHSSRLAPGAKELWLRHVPHGIEHATRQERASVSPCAPMHQAHHSPGEGSGVTTCPEAPSPSPSRRGLWSHRVSHDSRPVPCT
jgi:hypothetical protein